MAQQDRTEKATPKHREKAREKGQVARSADAGGSLVMIAGLFGLSLLGPQIVTAAAESFKRILAEIADPAQATSATGLTELLHRMVETMAITVGPIAAICMLTGVVAGVAQVGFHPSPKALVPDFHRVNPISGMRNLFSPNLVFEAFKAVTKVSAVAAVAALAVVPSVGGLVSLVGITPGALGTVMSQRAMSVAQHAAYAYLAIGTIDYIWQRHRHAKQLRMTKQEVKDEQRQYSVSAEVRSAQRRRQMQAARARMMAAVPEADVVVTNPTHYAVALRYDGTLAAPEVVAKGQDLIAAQIRKVAEENDVPVIPDPPLARALHSSTEIGQVIPEELYAAVAQVLAFVYRLAARRRRAV
jgi:flagellar biosynthetic protein FlhB